MPAIDPDEVNEHFAEVKSICPVCGSCNADSEKRYEVVFDGVDGKCLNPECKASWRVKVEVGRERVGIIIHDLMGGDACYYVVSEEDYNTIVDFHPTMKWMEGTEREQDVFDSDKCQEMIHEYFYEPGSDDTNDKVLEEWFTQTNVPEKIDLSKYDVIGMLTLPGG